MGSVCGGCFEGVKPAQTKRGSLSGGRNFVCVHENGKLTDFYTNDRKTIGEGAYGTVTKAKHKQSKAERAVKQISKAKLTSQTEQDKLAKEIDIMKRVDHPNVIKLFETFEDARFLYLVMELCTGGELFDRIIEASNFNEATAAILMEQMLSPIVYLHKVQICHRDLKPENFIFADTKPVDQSLLKIIDFGLSIQYKEGQVLTTKAGTPYYVAPEVLRGNYNQQCDVWSCGVIMYVLLSGVPPFYGDTDDEIMRKVKSGKYSYPPNGVWDHVSKDAKDLIDKQLRMTAKDRFTAQQALEDVWIKQKAPKATGVKLQDKFVDQLRNFRGSTRLKKAAIHVIAKQLDNEQIKNLTNQFKSLDADGDGQLTATELQEGMRKAGIRDIPADLQQLIRDIDSDGSGVIDYTEFLAATLEKRLYAKEDACWAAFQTFDKNGDGKIDQEELKQILGMDEVSNVIGAEGIKKLMADVDANGDGVIDWEEFFAMMKKM